MSIPITKQIGERKRGSVKRGNKGSTHRSIKLTVTEQQELKTILSKISRSNESSFSDSSTVPVATNDNADIRELLCESANSIKSSRVKSGILKMMQNFEPDNLVSEPLSKKRAPPTQKKLWMQNAQNVISTNTVVQGSGPRKPRLGPKPSLPCKPTVSAVVASVRKTKTLDSNMPSNQHGNTQQAAPTASEAQYLFNKAPPPPRKPRKPPGRPATGSSSLQPVFEKCALPSVQDVCPLNADYKFLPENRTDHTKCE